jgi:Predicted membrane protein (DUF2061)
MIREVTVGLGMIAGIAVLEAALIPVVVIGGAAVLAPKYLPRLRRSLQPAFDSIFSDSKPAAAASDGLVAKLPLAVPETLKIRQAVAKTITFRIIATTLDFTTNYLVIGELGAAAGLSSFALVFGPLFYLTHEASCFLMTSKTPGLNPAPLRGRMLRMPAGTLSPSAVRSFSSESGLDSIRKVLGPVRGTADLGLRRRFRTGRNGSRRGA